MARAEAYLLAKFHFDPSNRLATVHQRRRQQTAGQTGQWSDSIGRTVLQTVAQKLNFLFKKYSRKEKLVLAQLRHWYIGIDAPVLTFRYLVNSSSVYSLLIPQIL